MSEILTQFHFIRPFFLGLIVPALVIWYAWQRYSDPLRGWREQIETDLLHALAVGEDGAQRWRDLAVLCAWILAVVVAAGPTWKAEPNPFADDSSPLIVLLKADASMEGSDVAPLRLERARLKISDLAEARKGQPLGLYAYAGSAHLVLPPTRDTGTVAKMAAEISPEIMPAPGDHLELALAKAGDLLKKQETAGSILVIADTVDGDLKAMAKARRDHGMPRVEFLAVNEPGSSEDEALRKAAAALKAGVEPMSADDTDIEAIVRASAHAPVSSMGSARGGVQWQEGGWYLLPILALAVAVAFRREQAQQGEALP